MRTVIQLLDSRETGGAERVALQLLTGLDRRRWRVVLFHHGSPGLAPLLAEVTREGVETRVMPRVDSVRDLPRLPALIRAIRAERAAVLHAHLTWPLSCKYGLFAAWLAGVPAIVATAHTHVFPGMLSRGRDRLQPRRIATLVDRYLAVSASVASELRDGLRIPAKKIVVIRHGIDLGRWRVSPDACLRANLRGATTRSIVLTVARLDRYKGLPYLIEAAAAVPDATFVIAGEGPERPALEEMVADRGLQDRVLLVGCREDVPALLACADLFVLPSLSEGLPLVVMEAMAAGVPVIATAVGGVPELVRDGETGLLVAPADAAALAAAIRALLDNPAQAQGLGRAAQARAHRDFGAESFVEAVSAVYSGLLVKKTGGFRQLRE